MRWGDYWLGAPICFIFSVFYRIFKFLGLGKLDPKEKPKKILFIELSEMGSSILAYDAIKKAKKLFPQIKLYFLIFKERKKSVDILDIIPPKNILTVRIQNLFFFLKDTLGVIWFLRKNKIDTIIDLELFTRFSAILSFLSGAKIRIGFNRFHSEGLYRGNFLTHKVIYNPHHHISLNFIALVLALKSAPGEIPMLKKYLDLRQIIGKKIISSPQAKVKIKTKLKSENPAILKAKKLVILDPNFSPFIPVRSWPIENYIKLGKKILDIPGTFIIVTGDQISQKQTDLLSNSLEKSKSLNLAGQTSFSELIDLYSICDLLVTHDSGPAHFAAMSKIKSIVFFGPETPKLYGPLNHNCKVLYTNFACSPCVSAFNQRHTPCQDNRCLKAIKPEYVFKLIKKYLFP
jgi:ADP-heptose:LPS heptosyltransferase